MERNRLARSNRLLLVMALVLVGLLAVTAIIVAVREPTRFDPGSPEAAVQDYLEAVLAEDAVSAHDMLSAVLQARCDIRDLEDRSYRSDGERIVLVGSTFDDAGAVVDVEFTASYSDGVFDYSQYSYEERFELAMFAGDWRIVEPPWPYYWCPEEES